MYEPYPPPIDQFPQVMQDAISEAQRKSKAPFSMIMGSALTAAALACQSAYRVRRPNTSPCPLCLNLVHMADSGERKTTVDKHFTKWLTDFLLELAKEQEDKEQDAQAHMLLWEQQSRRLKREMSKISDEGDAANADLIARAKALLAAKPIPPRKPLMIYKDATPEALLASLHKSWPSACVLIDEGPRFFEGGLGRSLYLLNNLWDGSPQRVDRKTQESFTLEGVSLSISVMMPSYVFRKLLKNRGDEALLSGFLPRCLLIMPTSTQGFRTEDPNLNFFDRGVVETPALDRFTDILKDLLVEAVPNLNMGSLVDSKVLEFSGDAQREWIHFSNNVEYRIGQLFDNPGARAACAKLGEQVARIAGIFHCIEKYEGQYINAYVLKRAVAVGWWFFEQFMRITNELGVQSIAADAQILCDWLNKEAGKSTISLNGLPVKISLNSLYHHGPNKLRLKDRARPAIEYAQSMGWIQYVAGRTAHFLVWYRAPRLAPPWSSDALALSPFAAGQSF